MAKTTTRADVWTAVAAHDAAGDINNDVALDWAHAEPQYDARVHRDYHWCVVVYDRQTGEERQVFDRPSQYRAWREKQDEGDEED